MLRVLFSIENFINNRLIGSILYRLIDFVRPAWIRFAIIGTVLLFSLVLPAIAPKLILFAVIGLVPLAIGFVIYLRWPPLGLIALIVTAMIVPSPHLPGGFNFAVLLLMLLLGLWILDMVLNHKIYLVPSRTVAPFLIFLAITLLAFANGQLQWFNFAHPAPLDAQIGGLFIFILAAGAYFLVGNQVDDVRWLKWMTWTFLALGGLFVLGWIVPGLGSITSRIYQLGVTSNAMFWTWLVALAFSQAAFNEELPLKWRSVLGGLVLVTLYVAYFKNSEWKSGYLPPLVSIAAIIGIRSWRLGLLMGLAAIGPAMFIGSEAVATDGYSYGTRIDAWIIILKMVRVNPILGFGPANYYWYTPLFPIRGYAVQFNSHNQYMDILAQTGLLGLGCFVWLAVAIGWLAWTLKDRVSSGFAQAYVYGGFGGWIGTLASGILVDWFFPFTYNIGLNGFRGSMIAWLFLGGLVSFEQMLRQQRNRSDYL